MSTLADAIRELITEMGMASSDEIRSRIEKKYPEQWRASSLQAHLYACAINNPKAYIHHPFAKRFLYKNGDGTFELYSEEQHGPNIWAPDVGGEDGDGPVELIESTISLERDIEDHLVKNLELIEAGLSFKGRQIQTDVGRVDIIAEDAQGRRVVIELKVGDAKDSAIGQIARYLGYYSKTDQSSPRGILIAADFSDGLRYAAKMIPDLILLKYRVHFSFESCDLPL